MMQIITITHRADPILMEENAREERSTGMLDVSTEYQAQAQRVSHFPVHRGDAGAVPPYMSIFTSLFPRVGNLLSAFEPATGNTSHGKREQAPVRPVETWLTFISEWNGAHVYKVDWGNGARYTDNGWQSLYERQKAVVCNMQNRLFASVSYVIMRTCGTWRRAAA